MLTRRALPAWMVATVGGLAALTPLSAYAQSCPVESGASGVLNAYYPGSSSVSAGSSSISLGSRTGASTNIAAGDLLLVVQVQDATFATNNDSRYGDGVRRAKGFEA